MSNEQPQGITPAMVLRQHPAPWTSITYADGTIRVFDAGGIEVGLLDVLNFALGMTRAAAAKTQAAQEAAAQA